MKATHIILRNATRAQGGLLARGAAVEAAPAPSIETDQISDRQAAQLSRDPDVAGVAPIMPVILVQPRSERDATAQDAGAVAWGVRAVRADTSNFSGAGIVVAVLDTGIKADHPAFAGVEITSRNFTDEPDGDRHGHGTHCAGTIFGRAVQGTRIGVAPGISKVLIGKVLGAGGGSSDKIVEAMLWAANTGAQVISMSLGIDFPGFVKQMEGTGMPTELATSRALEAYRANVTLFERLVGLLNAQPQPTLVVAAAGNESRRESNPNFEVSVSPPAVAPGIVSVGALAQRADGTLGMADFSNTGPVISGPGVNIISAGLNGGLRSMSGTSMATPHVAGCAALWAEALKAQGNLNQTNLFARLVGHATFAGLQAGIDASDVGAGQVVAP
ncbi:MAG: S8 family serine peptidase [Rhodocyclaceae bacterium]|nr:S8 family serine peptidase [Rhodocyclaceae bacterium]